jgi:conjugal transfer/entry exclusion protein
VEQLEESVETVADTVEPLQGVANGVGRVSNRLSRQS